MRKLTYIILFNLLFTISVSAQINTLIDDFIDSIPTFDGSHFIRPVNGKIEFLNLPEPLKQTNIQFTLEVKSERKTYYLPKDMWEVRIITDLPNTKLLSDSILYWPGPHNVGDIFTGEISIIPLCSGFNGFKVGVRGIESRSYLEAKWCLDENGNLSFLGNTFRKRIECDPAPATFFNKDSVVIYSAYYANPKMRSILYKIVIEPPLKVGDTSNVRYELKSMVDLSDGFDIRIYSSHFDIIDYPKYNNIILSKDEEYEMNIKLTPLAYRDLHRLNMVIHIKDKKTSDIEEVENLSFCAIFNDFGELKIIGQRDPIPKYNPDKPLVSTTRDILSKVLPEANKLNAIDINIPHGKNAKLTHIYKMDNK